MSDVLKSHLESFAITFLGSFLVAVGTAVSAGQVNFGHLSLGVVGAVIVAATQSAVRLAWNKSVYGKASGVQK